MSSASEHDAGTPAHTGTGRTETTPGGRFRTQPVSFVRRGARLTTGRQRAWDTYAKDYVLDVPRHHADTSVDPSFELDLGRVFGRQAPLTVEVGSGLGEAIVHAAEQRPDENFLAVEVYLPGIAQTLMRMGKRNVRNIRLVQANAPEVLATMLPAASVQELWVFFPDPWHKTRHHKRRLVSPSFAEHAARVLQPGGLWRLATDWADYAAVMREVLDGREDFENLHDGSGADDGRGWAPRYEGRVRTSFEAKAATAGRTIHDLTYRRGPRRSGG